MNSSSLLRITKSPLSFNSISKFYFQMLSSTVKERAEIERGSQESPYILSGNNIAFSMMEPSYDSHRGAILLLILSVSPVDESTKRFKIKGKRAMLLSDAEKSTLRRGASSDVQFLLKNLYPRCLLLQFF